VDGQTMSLIFNDPNPARARRTTLLAQVTFFSKPAERHEPGEPR
jgi:hypothetical protein